MSRMSSFRSQSSSYLPEFLHSPATVLSKQVVGRGRRPQRKAQKKIDRRNEGWNEESSADISSHWLTLRLMKRATVCGALTMPFIIFKTSAKRVATFSLLSRFFKSSLTVPTQVLHFHGSSNFLDFTPENPLPIPPPLPRPLPGVPSPRGCLTLLWQETPDADATVCSSRFAPHLEGPARGKQPFTQRPLDERYRPAPVQPPATAPSCRREAQHVRFHPSRDLGDNRVVARCRRVFCIRSILRTIAKEVGGKDGRRGQGDRREGSQ